MQYTTKRSRHWRSTSLAAVLVVLAALLLTSARPGSAAAAPAQRPPSDTLASMSLAEQVGQVFMVGTPATGATAAALDAVHSQHVGSVILTGRSTQGIGAAAHVVAVMRAADPSPVGLLVATDQEGGAVQVLQGSGYSAIPSALTQGRSSATQLRRSAGTWGSQLSRTGIDLDLAPVLGTVPSPAAARRNPPIGVFDRELGFDPGTVASHGVAFTQGMADAGELTAVKHFPGLGRVSGNTDTTAGVQDRVTVRGDAYTEPFAAAVRAGAPVLMMSSATYTKIDSGHPAVFSRAIIENMVRHDLGFTGAVMSDDLGNAKQVAYLPPGQRAVRFIQAGGDLVLTVNAAVLPAMYDAVLAEARTDATFRRQVQEAAIHVLDVKRRRGLLPGPSCPRGTSTRSDRPQGTSRWRAGPSTTTTRPPRSACTSTSTGGARPASRPGVTAETSTPSAEVPATCSGPSSPSTPAVRRCAPTPSVWASTVSGTATTPGWAAPR